MTDPLTPSCFSTSEESAYYYEALAELAEQETQEQAENPISTNRAIEIRNGEALPIPQWLLDEGHDLELEPETDLEPLEAVEALEVAA